MRKSNSCSPAVRERPSRRSPQFPGPDRILQAFHVTSFRAIMVHVLEFSQVIKAGIVPAWDFFSDPRNLARITPPELDFKILTELPARVYPGMMIEYRVRPLLGIPVRWVSEITHVEPGKFFVDEQRIGPYRIWHHEHHFKELDGGRVEINDRVTYVLPFGPLGNLAHPFLVKPRLAKIFAFREQAVNRIFARPEIVV
jgi:ligand-binding SRPBCC domain-containing protein